MSFASPKGNLSLLSTSEQASITGGQWACPWYQGTDPHTCIKGKWWAPLLCLQLTSHTCWTSSHTQPFVRARCVCLEDECVCFNWLGPGSTTASLLQTHMPQMHTHVDTQLSVQCLHTREAYASLNASSLSLSLSLSLSHTHTQIHTDTNHVEQRLQLERVFSWLSVQFSGHAKCGS